MFYEDFEVDTEYVTAPLPFTAESITEFASQYDPQPFHVDVSSAADSIYGGLIASGWQVLATAFGGVVRLGLFEEGGQGTGRLDEVYWVRPVRPGDIIKCHVLIVRKRESSTRPDRGYVHMQFTVRNQRGEDVAGFRCDEIALKRPSQVSAP